METVVCPSCKKKMSHNAKKCPDCGFIFRRRGSIYRMGAIAVVVLIITASAAYMLSGAPENAAPYLPPYIPPEEVQAETLKDIHGTEFILSDITDGFNSFMRDGGVDSFYISELVPEFGEAEDVYRDIKNNDDISISMVTPKGRSTVTSVFVAARRSGREKPTAFLTYCFALMNIFNPTMAPAVRQRVLYNMMGYAESEDVPLHNENTYIIENTKYTFVYAGQKELNMLIEQMPKLELYSGDLPFK